MIFLYNIKQSFWRILQSAALGFSLASAALAQVQTTLEWQAPTPREFQITWRAAAQTYKPDARAHLIQAPYDTRRVFSFDKDGGLFHSTDQGKTWSWLGDPFTLDYGQALYFDPANQQVLYAQRGATEIVKSLDGGKTWQAASAGLPASSGAITTAPLVIHPRQPQVLWLGGQNLWHSVNGGASWQTVGALQHTAAISALAVAPQHPGLVLAGTANGYIVRNENAAAKKKHKLEWSEERLRKGAVAALAFAADGQTVYAAYATSVSEKAKKKQAFQIYRSADGGQTWQGMDEQPLGREVHCLVIDPRNSQKLYVGTDRGVYGSADGGAHWFALSDGSAVQEPVRSLTLSRNEQGEWLYRVSLSSGLIALPLKPDSQPQFNLPYSR